MISGSNERPEASTSGENGHDTRVEEKKEKEKEVISAVPFYKLFAFADSTDYMLMIIGTIGAMGNGICMPLMTILFGDLINSFGQNQNSEDVVKVVSKSYHITWGRGEPASEKVVLLKDEQLSKEETARRIKLLQEDSELQDLHRKFVMDYCWKTCNRKFTFTNQVQKSLDMNASRKTKQRLGLKSDMSFNVKPASDGQIFAQKPAVRHAYLNFVPNKMTEVDFWTKFWKAQYIQSTKNVVTAAVEAAGDEHLVVFVRHDAILASESRQQIRKVDPTLDMAADEGDDYTHIPLKHQHRQTRMLELKLLELMRA